jgi:co-chaperonin GroES (HSP10)
MGRDYKYVDKTVVTELENIDDFKLGINMVLIEPVLETSKIGETGMIRDTYFEEIHCAQREVKVIRTPSILAIKGDKHYDEKFIRALDWHTQMQIQEGDLAWVDPISVLNNNNTLETNVYRCDGKIYMTVKYDKFIAVKRGDLKILLNGYMLIEKIEDNQDSVISGVNVKSSKSRVVYTGDPNKYYFNKAYTDQLNVSVGDVIQNPRHLIPFEGDLYKNFDKGKEYFIIQRRNVPLIYNAMDLEGSNIPIGKLLVKRDEKEEVTVSGIIIPPNKEDLEKVGTVVKIGGFRTDEILPGLGLGSKVSFSRHQRDVEIEEVTYLFIDIADIILYTKSEK